MINIKENVKDVKEFNLLYDLVGWGSYDDKISKRALDNTYYSVSIYADERIVGYGRIIGDTICFMYIQNIMVDPMYQGNGIGTMVMNKLLSKIYEIKKDNPDLRTYFGASKGRESFYERFGFVRRIDADLGYGMILEDNIN